MPFGGKPLPDDQIELFRRWIREGAKDDSPAGAAIESLFQGQTVYRAARHRRSCFAGWQVAGVSAIAKSC
jgi:hypothetical protein